MTIENAFLAKITVGLKTALSELDQGAADTTALLKQRSLLVALSGGPDSTALLLALHLLAPDSGFVVHVAHVNHQLRGAESDGDQAFCRALCESLSIPFTALLDPDAPLSESGGESLPAEARLRQTRYRLLAGAARASGCEVLVVAHTLDDQLETLLFRLFRGAALGGIVGMKSLKRLPGGVCLVRPMLSVRRLDCLEFLQALRVEARFDASNEDQRYSRNYLRHSVLPVIEKRFPHVRVQLERFRQRVQIEDDFLTRETERLLGTLGGVTARRWPLALLRREHAALTARALARALEGRGIEVTFERIEAIGAMIATADSTQPALTLDKTWDVVRQGEFLVFLNRAEKPKRILSDAGLILRLPGATPLIALGKALRIEELEAKEVQDESLREVRGEQNDLISADRLEVAVDLSLARLPLLLRHRRPGDLIRPLGMTQLVNLKKYLHTHKRPEWFFDHWLATVETILVADRNEVLWVPGLGVSERLRVQARPTHRLSFIDLDQHVTTA